MSGDDDREMVLKAERPDRKLPGEVAHPSPHAARDKIEEWDMRKRGTTPLEGHPGQSDGEVTFNVPHERLGQGADGGGLRLNAGKNRMELTLPEWEWALADVSTKGSFKYDEWNWLLGMKWSSMIGCMKRHLVKFVLGERYDGPRFDKVKGTTGCHHLAMVAWNALALMTYDIRELGEDDRATLVKVAELLARVNAETSDLKERLNDV